LIHKNPLKYWGGLLLLLTSVSAFSQDKYIHQGSYWIRYYNQTQVTNKVSINFHVDERRLVNPSRQFQLFFHAHVNYLVKPWLEIAAGGNFNWTNSSVNTALRVPEWRPWQEVNLIKPLAKGWQFQFRYRLDERFVHNNNRLELQDGYHYNWRHRLRVQFVYPIKNSSGPSKWLLRLSDEVMINSGDVADVFDQNRAYLSIQYSANKHWAVECGYMNMIQSRSSDDGFYDRNVIRLTLYHRIDLRRSKPDF
jgi:hypothetical protein